MTRGWTIPHDVTRQLMTDCAVEQYLAGDIGFTQDPRMRAAEVVDLVRHLEARVGRTYNSEGELDEDLYATAIGGGFGIPTILREVVAAILTAPPTAEPDPLRRLEPSPAIPPAPLDHDIVARLGLYVYALRDPRDQSVFYVGKGCGNRIYSHVWAALGIPAPTPTGRGDTGDSPSVVSAKLDRILQIHRSGHQVEHWIIRHALTPDTDDDRTAFAVEQGMIDVLRLREVARTTPILTNLAGGHTDTEFGAVLVEELACRFAADPIPNLTYPCIVLKVNGAASPHLTDEQLYEMARRSWPAGRVRHLTGIPIIVIAENLVRAVYRVSRWTAIETRGNTVLYEFTGALDDALTKHCVGRELLPTDIGLPAWPMRGWAPRLAPAE